MCRLKQVFGVFLAAVFCTSLVTGDLEATFQRCCPLGSNWASEGLKCSQFPAPVTGVPPEQQSVCLSAVEICCIKTHREQMCELGKTAAAAGKDCLVDKKLGGEFQKDCCEGCKLGLISGSMGDSCTFSSFSFGSPWDEAYQTCCTKSVPNATSTPSTTSAQTIGSSTLSDTAGIPTPALDSLCDLLPGELCAHMCVPTPGSYRCECRPGFTLMSDKKSCQIKEGAKDRCAVNNPCSQKCKDTGIAVECSCHPGFHLGTDKRTCVGSRSDGDTPVGKCPPGYQFNARSQVCDDFDECVMNTDNCGPNHICQNTIGSFTCGRAPVEECQPGFVFSEFLKSCQDVDECTLKSDNCNREKQHCLNKQGGFLCEDKKGKNECPAGYKFHQISSSCIDIDECEEHIHICNPESESCVNEPGGYRCVKLSETTQQPTSCQPGFRLHSTQRGCVDIDECAENIDQCDSNQICTNSPGSFTCSCKPGYGLDPVTQACIDINECQINQHECLPSQRCDNTIGSYHCIRFTSCGTGYTLNSQSGLCEDDDECVLRTDNCRFLGPVFQCRNTAGSFRCERKRCDGGLKLNNQGICVGPSGLPLVTTTTPTTTTTYIPPEAAVTRGVITTTRPTLTTAVICPVGYIVENGKCIVNACERPNICRRNQRCIIVGGSHRCINLINCNVGFEANEGGTQCVDMDECTSGRHECKRDQLCLNRPGSYVCQCPSGHTPNQNKECVDIDECSRYAGRICSNNAECRNTVGSYVCHCKPGFKQAAENTCEDIDECKERTGLCQHNCTNLWGSYHCSCLPGFVLSSDNRTCTDLDECELFRNRRICGGNCVNIPGSYLCACADGYRMGTDNRTCQDIDECQDSNVCPNPNEICFNIRGSYRCNTINCPSNFIRDTEHKNRCKRASLYCREGDQACLRMPLSYTYNYMTFVSNMAIPTSSHLDLFTMRGPLWQTTTARFNLELVDTRTPNAIRKVSRNFFRLRNTSPNQAVISLVEMIPGPQEIELQLTMDIYRSGEFSGSAVAKLFIYVSQYEY